MELNEMIFLGACSLTRADDNVQNIRANVLLAQHIWAEVLREDRGEPVGSFSDELQSVWADAHKLGNPKRARRK